MERIQLSPSFFLDEYTRSPEATRHGFTEQFTPPDKVVNKLKALCFNLMEPLKAAVERKYPGAVLSTTSGYRCPRVNVAVGGTVDPPSQHQDGEAGDKELRINGIERNILLAKLVLEENLDFDQMILEYGPSLDKPEWIHLSWDLDKPKQRQAILRIEYRMEAGKRVKKCYGLTRATVLNAM